MNLRAFFNHALYRKLAAEALGSALLLTTVVGSGIMGERLEGASVGGAGIVLLANSLATGAALFALIVMLAPISGAHFNPLVTMIEALSRRMPRHQAPFYIAAQFAGTIAGVFIAHLMFELPLIHPSQHVRTGASQWFSEFVATFGLLCVILFGTKSRVTTVAGMVASYITAAYWFTASTSLANPAVAFARSLCNTFADIRMIDAPLFMVAQLMGALTAYALYRWMVREQ